MLWGLLIFIEAMTTIILAGRIKAPAAGILIMAYIVLMKATFYAFSHLGLQFNLGVTSDMGYYYKGNETLGIYTVLFWSIAFSLVWVPRKANWLNSFRSSLETKISKRSGTPLLIILLTILILNIILMNKSAIWLNHEYLLITGPKGYYLPPNIAMLFIAGMNIGAVICSIFLPFYIKKSRTQALLACAAWFFWFAFYLSAGSRVAAVMFFSAMAIQFLISRGKTSIIYLLVGFFGAFIIMMIALATRASGEYGVSNFFGAISYFSGKVAVDFAIFSWVNFMQGIFITSDGIIYDHFYNTDYKFLSFSPLPSFIDSFDKVRQGSQIMIYSTVPMSGIAELYHFGISFFAFYIIALIFILRAAHKSFGSKFYYLTAFANFYIFIMFIIMNSYAIRNSFRQTLLAYAVIVGTGLFVSIKKALAREPMRPRLTL